MSNKSGKKRTAEGGYKMNRLRILYLSKQNIILVIGIILGMMLFPHYMIEAATEEKRTEKDSIEAIGTIDSVHKDNLVIDDSAVFLNRNVHIYDENGKGISQSQLKQGDQVAVTFIEDESAGTQRIVSIQLVKKGSGVNGDTFSESGQGKANSPQVIKKVNGVWTN